TIASPTGDETDVHVTSIGRKLIMSIDLFEHQHETMHEIAFALQNAFRALGETDLTLHWDDAGSNAGFFEISPAHRGDTSINILASSATHPDVVALGNLVTSNTPPFETEDSHIDGTGTVDFGAARGTEDSPFINPTDRWTRTAAPSDGGGRLDATTMPIQIVRTTISPLVFDVDPVAWVDRLDGDNQSNPLSELWSEGLNISAMGFYKNRFALAGDEVITFSQSGDVFNFFNEQFDNVGGADPITRTLADSERVTLISDVIPYRSKVFIFTETDVQFQITSEDAFTPSDATITVSSRNANTASVTPTTASDKMYVAADDGKSGTIDEYTYDDLLVSTDAVDIAAHVPDLLPTDIKRIVSSSNHGTLAAIGTDGFT
ncbi:hypothetical protein LCGC14_2950740, partial [marine sediment metagenome]